MDNSSENYQTISHLNKQHRYFYDLFIMHQKYLMRGDIKSAQDRFLELKKNLKHHMNAENDFLLPLYEKHISPIPAGGAVEFFIHEHHKINRFLDEFSGLSLDVIGKSTDLVNLFDQYYKFKHLLDHHHTREDTFLFRLLDKSLTEDEKKEVLKYFAFNNT
jgi:iron-sulfur cluster repair protein YtfE (RIC family)